MIVVPDIVPTVIFGVPLNPVDVPVTLPVSGPEKAVAVSVPLTVPPEGVSITLEFT